MHRSLTLLVALVVAYDVSVWGVAHSDAAGVSLPFNESFNTPGSDASFPTDYPAFTTTGGLTRNVDAGGVLRTGGGGFPSTSWTTVTPTPVPVGGILIKVDMGWDGMGLVGPGFGAAALRLGENTIVFHPGFNGPPGAFRVDGPGGSNNQSMGYVPAIGVLNRVEILSSPSGLFDIKVTDGTNPANVFTTSFTNAASYGGEIGPSALAGASGMFDNLSITAVPEPASLGLGATAFFLMVGLARGRAKRAM